MSANERRLPAEVELTRYVERMLAATPVPRTGEDAGDAHSREAPAKERAGPPGAARRVPFAVVGGPER